MVETKNLKREFKFNKDGTPVTLPDPNPTMTVAEVMQYYSGQYPELTTATVDEPVVEGKKASYKVKTTVGTKG